MPKAIFNGATIAESETTEVVEGNHYFPPSSLKAQHLTQVDTTTVCGWKGTANYYDVVVDGQVAAGAAFTYRNPKDAASQIKDHVAFWKGVEIVV